MFVNKLTLLAAEHWEQYEEECRYRVEGWNTRKPRELLLSNLRF